MTRDFKLVVGLLALALCGCGAESAPSLLMAGKLSFSSSPLNFGVIGTATQRTLTLTLSNSGSATLTLGVLSSSALGLSEPLSLVSGGSCQEGTELAEQGSCTVLVEYSPFTTGTDTQSAQFAFQSAGSTYTSTLTIQGTAVPPGEASFSDGATYNFGAVDQYGSASHTELVTNTGGLPISFGTLTSASIGLATPFTLAGGTCSSGETLAAGSSCTLIFEFAPQVSGAVTPQLASVPFTTQGVSSTSGIIELEGSGIPAGVLQWSVTSSFAYPQVQDGDSSSQSFTLTNVGSQPLTLGTISDAGLALVAPFAWTGGSCSTGESLAPASSCTLEVAFSPTIRGAYGDTVTVPYASAGQSFSTQLALSGVGYDYIPLSMNQAAGTVIGEPDFNTTSGSLSQTGLSFPSAVDVAADGSTRILDYANTRIMGFNAVPTDGTLGPPADFEINQPDYTSNAQTDFSSDYDAHSGGTTYGVIANSANSSGTVIDLFTPLPTSTTPPISVVLGDGFGNCTATSYLSVYALAFADGKLIASSDNRLLIWNSIPTTSGTPPDLVLGQPNFTSCAQSGIPSASSFGTSYGVWTDGTRLAIVDEGSSRVLIWNTFPTVNNQPADIVLGQPDMVSSTANNTPGAPGTASAQSLAYPWGITSNGRQLFVSDNGNNRILVWNSFPTTNQQAADVVLGQADFSGSASAAGATGLYYPTGIFVVKGTQLLVADALNNRVLVWYGQH